MMTESRGCRTLRRLARCVLTVEDDFLHQIKRPFRASKLLRALDSKVPALAREKKNDLLLATVINAWEKYSL